MDIMIKLIADGMLVLIVLLAGYALLFRVTSTTHRYHIYTRILMAGLTTYMTAKVIAACWQPEQLRPFEQLGKQAGAAYLNNPGFPSDHVLFATCLTLAIYYATRSRKLTIILATMTVVMAIGRVMALVHTPLDVIGGMVIGCVGIVWYLDIFKQKHHKAIVKKAKK